MNKYFSIVVIACAIFISACKTTNRTIFSQQLYKDSELNSDDLKKVQFYVDRDITLQRSADQSSTDVSEGDIVMKGGKRTQQIVIRSGTKGVLVFMPKDDRLGISFDANDPNKFLMFGPNPKNRNRYTLLANDWNQNYGVITYGNEKWTALAQSAGATLLVELSDQRSHSYKTTVEKGRSVK